MNSPNPQHIYGPVPSRRLGRSLGIDLVPYKVCTYDCVYCQLGRTTNKTNERKAYLSIDQILDELERKLATISPFDYITLAGSGEPTLHLHIGTLIQKIKKMTHVPVAVLTNGSLLWMEEVRESLMEADVVIPSLDAGNEKLFLQVNRPHSEITFEKMLAGLIEFTKHFPKAVWLEVFLLAKITGIPDEVENIARLAKQICPAQVHLNTIARPPAESFALPVHKDVLNGFANYFVPQAKVIADFQNSTIISSLDLKEEDILALLSRRPCTIKDIAEGLGANALEVMKIIDSLKLQKKINEVFVNEKWFYTVSS